MCTGSLSHRPQYCLPHQHSRHGALQMTCKPPQQRRKQLKVSSLFTGTLDIKVAEIKRLLSKSFTVTCIQALYRARGMSKMYTSSTNFLRFTFNFPLARQMQYKQAQVWQSMAHASRSVYLLVMFSYMLETCCSMLHDSECTCSHQA